MAQDGNKGRMIDGSPKGVEIPGLIEQRAGYSVVSAG